MSQILVVDDNQAIRRMLARKLEKLGHQVHLAEGGSEALALLQTEPVELVLLDQMMPEMDGSTTFEKIYLKHAQLPVIMITAHSSVELAVAFVKAGGTDFIEKPIDFEMLELKIRQALELSETNKRLELERAERRQAEEAVRQSEEHLRQVIASISDHIYMTEVTSDGKFLNHYLSPHLDCLTGYPLEVFLEDWHFWGQMIHPEDRYISALQASELAAGKNSETEYRLVRADGSIVWVRDSARIERQGASTMIYGLISDVTARKQSEQALIESEQRHRGLFENSPISLWEEDFSAVKQYLDTLAAQGVTDLEKYFDAHPQAVIVGVRLLKVIDVNKATLELSQADSKETLFQSFSVWELTEAEADLFKEQLIAIGRGQTTFEAEGAGRTVAGDRLQVRLRWSVAPGYEQSWAKVLVSITDLTERRNMEQSLLAAQKLADLGTLAAGVAHEINSPLQVITGLSQSLLKRLEQGRLEPEYCARKLEILQRNGWRCAEIVRALKTYAYASATELEAHNLVEIIRDTLLLTEHQFRSWSNISIVTELDPDLPQLVCDRNQIAQVLINLLSNARDAMPTGGEIAIRTGFEADTRRLWLQVADSGLGIPEKIKKRIFDPFFTTKAVGQGTGLGLSIINGIVRAHGGEIRVESAPKQGAVLTLYFPVAAEQAEAVITHLEQSGRFDEHGRVKLVVSDLDKNIIVDRR